MNDEETILEHFFTNTNKPIFALRNMPPALQNYIYMGISRFPDVRGRFLELIKEKEDFKAVVTSIKNEQGTERILKNTEEYARERNKNIFFNFGHKSSGEGSNVFVVCENNPIYGTEIQQDFYFPLTTMEFSTRYGKRFSFDRIYWDPDLLKSEFASRAKEVMKRNMELYEKGFEILKEEGKSAILDSLRVLIPIAAHTTVLVGGNTRGVLEHFRKMLTYNDNFIQDYTKKALKEMEKVRPEFFKDVMPDNAIIEREKRLREYAKELFQDKFSPLEEMALHYDTPSEELVLAQIIYPYCNLTLKDVLDKVSSFSKNEREELFELATEGRKSNERVIRGFETRPLVFEMESRWCLWKDMKRHRMNLRFQQDMRGKAGFETPTQIAKSELKKEYVEAMKKTSDLIEDVFSKYGGSLSKTVAAQGSRKRYLLCMGARQLTTLSELRVGKGGDKGYVEIARKMMELAKEKNPTLFSHISLPDQPR